MEAVQPPSPDEPATRQAKRARESITIGWRANEAKLRRMREFINSMKQAHGGYIIQEDDVAATFEGANASEATDTQRQGGRPSPRSGTGSLFEEKGNK